MTWVCSIQLTRPRREYGDASRAETPVRREVHEDRRDLRLFTSSVRTGEHYTSGDIPTLVIKYHKSWSGLFTSSTGILRSTFVGFCEYED